jgi:predicted Mrr-cat superfamily restriction endonuclease
LPAADSRDAPGPITPRGAMVQNDRDSLRQVNEQIQLREQIADILETFSVDELRELLAEIDRIMQKSAT